MLYIVLELVECGELFNKISTNTTMCVQFHLIKICFFLASRKKNNKTKQNVKRNVNVARMYFQQLLNGIQCMHKHKICQIYLNVDVLLKSAINISTILYTMYMNNKRKYIGRRDLYFIALCFSFSFSCSISAFSVLSLLCANTSN
ncbi:hypothetical protein RFI_29253 [Reticulomyxa filosa]|uniref:Protein kinase domain-containing protein n=1 Tax=Reticulomyxa filosa TaxID=46433 RepID=X6M3A7_RETFI|nr:hypothetical protein RFI_29253 [Reticulomyxa filosa]|eukprot:ETO08131.1 hypothetical protein RFI_29253 [Reticulomyxa filosa]